MAQALWLTSTGLIEYPQWASLTLKTHPYSANLPNRLPPFRTNPVIERFTRKGSVRHSHHHLNPEVGLEMDLESGCLLSPGITWVKPIAQLLASAIGIAFF